jgi:hypothetical protein
MKLARIVLALNFREPASQFTALHRAARAVVGPSRELPSIVTPATLQIKLKQKKALLLVEPQKLALSMEQYSSKGEFSQLAFDVFEKVQREIDWAAISRIGVRTMWLKEAGNFTELKDLHGRKLYQHTDLLSGAADVGVALTFEQGDNEINYAAGPMQRDQFVSQFSPDFERSDIPESFAFVDVDYHSMLNKHYSRKVVDEYLGRAYDFGERKALETFSVLEI